MVATRCFVFAATKSSALVHSRWYEKTYRRNQFSICVATVVTESRSSAALSLSPRLNVFFTVALLRNKSSALVCPRRYKTYYRAVVTTWMWCEPTSTAATARQGVKAGYRCHGPLTENRMPLAQKKCRTFQDSGCQRSTPRFSLQTLVRLSSYGYGHA